MIKTYAIKVRKAVWFTIIRGVGLFHPRTGTRLSIRFYSRAGMKITGAPTFISSSAWFDGTQNYALITLHEGCNISRDVRILTHDWSPYTALRSLGRTKTSPVGRLSPVEVGPHAFIGLGAILLPGARVGRGAIVGAGAVVRGAVNDYAIVVGNPSIVVGDSRSHLAKNYPDEWRAVAADLPR